MDPLSQSSPDFIKSEEKLLSRKNILSVLMVLVLLLVIPFGVNLIQKQQIFKGKAAVVPITFTGTDVKCDAQGNCSTTTGMVSADLRSPLGPPVGSGGTPTPTPGGGGSTKVYVDPNPATSGSSVVMIATGPNTCSSNIGFDPGQGLTECSKFQAITCSGDNPKDSNQCWWKKTCTAGAAGNYTASFNANGASCQSSTNYQIK
ncbi:hypothetical protein HY385_03165 [Candidatus Daviesbacteria bacterium]|nr:hypothetical protein [Candidatus Daviesbacteria bacterium]